MARTDSTLADGPRWGGESDTGWHLLPWFRVNRSPVLKSTPTAIRNRVFHSQAASPKSVTLQLPSNADREMTLSSIGDEKGLGFSWRSVIWAVNGFFLLTTVIVAHLPDSSSAGRVGAIQYLAQFSLAEEKNLAAFWEGWCFLLVSILAFERYLQSSSRRPTYEGQSWLGLSVLGAALSLDELGSIHERAPLLFSSWGLSGSMSSLIPLAVPVLLILVVTLHRMLRIANRRGFWLTLCAFLAFGSVAFQEYLEHKLQWPWWARGLRVGVEEGTELVGFFYCYQ